MVHLNRRQFLASAALTTASVITHGQVKAQIFNTPGALEREGQEATPKQIIIVGAGISGLVAAYELVAVGHRVTVLDARERVGGRIFTLRDRFSEGNIVEAGAARIQPTHDLTIAYAQHFGLRLTPFYPSEGRYVAVQGNQHTLLSIEELSQSFSGGRVLEWTKIAGGSDRLPQAFATALGDNIHLGEAVAKIQQNEEGVQVLCQSGRQYEGDCLICTVPLTVMDTIDFQPALSAAKQLAIAGGYNYRPATRMFVEFPERFWQKEGLNGWGLFLDRAEELWQPTWDRPSQSGILHAYLKGSNALEIDALNSDQQLALLLQRWSAFLPNVHDYDVSAISHSWTNDPWSQGGWAYPSDEQEASLFLELGRREGRLYFAGDHTSPTRGWMQGALDSGLKAARHIQRTDGV